jgi:hypothetical protein
MEAAINVGLLFAINLVIGFGLGFFFGSELRIR